MNIISLAIKFLQGHDENNNLTTELNKYNSYDELRQSHPELNYVEESLFDIQQFLQNYYIVTPALFKK